MSDAIKINVIMKKHIDDELLNKYFIELQNYQLLDLSVDIDYSKINNKTCIVTNAIDFVRDNNNYIGYFINYLIKQDVKNVLIFTELAKSNNIEQTLLNQLCYYNKKVEIKKYFNNSKVQLSNLILKGNLPPRLIQKTSYVGKYMCSSMFTVKIDENKMKDLNHISELIKQDFIENENSNKNITSYRYYNINGGFYDFDVNGKCGEWQKYKLPFWLTNIKNKKTFIEENKE